MNVTENASRIIDRIATLTLRFSGIERTRFSIDKIKAIEGGGHVASRGDTTKKEEKGTIRRK